MTADGSSHFENSQCLAMTWRKTARSQTNLPKKHAPKGGRCRAGDGNDPEAVRRFRVPRQEQQGKDRRQLDAEAQHIDHQRAERTLAQKEIASKETVELVHHDGRKDGRRQLEESRIVEQPAGQSHRDPRNACHDQAREHLLNRHGREIPDALELALLRSDIQHGLKHQSELQRHQEFDGHPDQREAAELVEAEGARHEDPGGEVATAHESLVDKRQVGGQTEQPGGALRLSIVHLHRASSMSPSFMSRTASAIACSRASLQASPS